MTAQPLVGPSASNASRSGAELVLAFDFGHKRIGVALGDTLLRQARALTVIVAEANADRFRAIERLLAEWHPAQLVVGLPLALDGAEHAMSARCRRFANQLHGRSGLPVALVDERLTSAEADAALREQGLGWRARRGRLDAVAAQLILQNWFDAHDTPRR